jgi:hypothetical protein
MCAIRLTRRVPIVKQQLLTFLELLSSLPVISVVRVTRSLVLYVCFIYRGWSFCSFFLLAIVLSVLRRYMDSDYSFGIFKLFLQLKNLIERMKHHYKLCGIIYVEYLLLYSVTLTLNK